MLVLVVLVPRDLELDRRVGEIEMVDETRLKIVEHSMRRVRG
jgi:hypothetical protein